MEQFVPYEFTPYINLLCTIALLWLTGYIFLKQEKITSGAIPWLITLFSFLWIHFSLLSTPPFFRMIAIISILILCMKIITWYSYQLRNNIDYGLKEWTYFSLLWFGMHPFLFLKKYASFPQKGKRMILFGLSRIILGLLFIYFSWWLHYTSVISNVWMEMILCSFILLAGLSLLLHFGILSIYAGIWRILGYKAYYLFNAPIKSTTLKEFWGKRWNKGFSEMIAISIYKPLKSKASNRLAFFIAFMFSGLLHELAISVPVNKGYGLPTLYFLLHACAQTVEEKINFKYAFLRRVWVISLLLLPLPILFHYYFLTDIIWPIIGLEFSW